MTEVQFLTASSIGAPTALSKVVRRQAQSHNGRALRCRYRRPVVFCQLDFRVERFGQLRFRQTVITPKVAMSGDQFAGS
jgi:hypothetical protein